MKIWRIELQVLKTRLAQAEKDKAELLEAVREQHGQAWCDCQNPARKPCWIAALLVRFPLTPS